MIWHSRRRADRPPHGPDESPGPTGESAGLPGWCNSESSLGASPDETPRLSRLPGDNGGESDKLAQNMIFDRLVPALKAPQQTALRQVLADLSGPAEPGELTVEAAVLARFRSRVHLAAAVSAAPAPVPRTPLWLRFAPHSPRLAAGLVAAAVVAGSTAAAYAGALPGPLQNFAHRVIDAPAGHPSGQRPGGGPHHRPGATRAARKYSGHVPHSATPGSTHAHTHPGRDAHPSRSPHPVQPRPAANSSPHPGRSSHPVPPQASQPARGSRPPQPSRGPQQTPPPHASRPPPGKPATPPSQAAHPDPHSQPNRPARPPASTAPEPGYSVPGGKLTAATP